MSAVRDVIHTRLVMATLGAGLVVCLAVKYYYKSKKRHNWSSMKWERVGEVTQLAVYPIKSARPTIVSTATASEEGLIADHVLDRSFIVCTAEGEMVTGRTAPMLTTMRPRITKDQLSLMDVDGTTVHVKLEVVVNNNNIFNMTIRGVDTFGLDCGEEVSKWLTNRLFKNHREVRLLYKGHLTLNRAVLNPSYYPFTKYKETDIVTYSDSTPYEICTTSSLEYFNSVADEQVTMERFRPTVVVNAKIPHDEDHWEYIKIGDNVMLRNVKPSERCIMTTVNPDNGIVSPEPLATLRKYRIVTEPPSLAKVWMSKPLFGIHCCIDQTGDMKTGDPVYVIRSEPFFKIKK